MDYIRKYNCAVDKVEQHYNCIYYYENKVNGKGYVGQTVNFINRFRSHKKPSSNKYLIDMAISKYGIENFNVYILEENIKSLDELNALEKEHISRLETTDRIKGYNIREGGDNSPMSEESRRKLSNSHRGKQVSNETKEKIREAMLGEGNPFYGKAHTEETKRKISESKKGQPSPRKGATLTSDTKQKLSEVRMGKYTGGNNPSARAVYCLTTSTKFETAKEASEWCGVGRTSITQCCIKNNKELKYTSGRHPETNEKLQWVYYDEHMLTDRKEM